MNKYLLFTLHDYQPLLEIDHDMAFGLLSVNEEVRQRLARQKELADVCFSYFGMSEVRFIDHSIYFVREKYDDEYMKEVVDLVSDIANSYTGEIMTIGLKPSAFGRLQTKSSDVCEARYLETIGVSYTAIMGDFIELETAADNYLALVEEALARDTVDHDIDWEIKNATRQLA